MTADPGPPWWSESLLALSPEIGELLADVDAAFAVSGAGLTSWPDPHPFGVSPLEDEYSRCADPGKFLIVAARAQAWRQVLLDRGWAIEAPPLRPARRRGQPDGSVAVLLPSAGGAVPLVVATHQPATPDLPLSITVGAGDPVVDLATIPGCGCDACDSGSAHLLEEMDTWVLSVVDGSLQVELSADRYSTRTSFGASASSPVQDLSEATAFTAAPWPARWTARPLVPELEPIPRRGRAAAIGDALEFNLRMMLRSLGIGRGPQVYRTRPWWRF